MITLTFIVVFVSLLCLASAIDMFMFDQPFFSALFKLLIQENGTNEWMINASVFIGFIYSIVVDYRLRKNQDRNQKKTSS